MQDLIHEHQMVAAFLRWRKLFRNEIGRLRLEALLSEKRVSFDSEMARRASQVSERSWTKRE